MVTTKTVAAAAMFAVKTCIGCAPEVRRLSRSRYQISPLYRCILLTTTTAEMIELVRSRWQILDHREEVILLVIFPRGSPTLLPLCSHPARGDGAVVPSTLSLTISG